ncbi:hypothetical protein [uncultured Mediterranean phage]|nr:hypothetical protein [uncultured Mediterranean phage]
MGGAARIIRRVFSPPAYTPPPAQTVTAAPVASATTISGASRTAKVRGQGMGTKGTIMTGATGIEEEANVSKTVLGGATTKKKKYKV